MVVIYGTGTREYNTNPKSDAITSGGLDEVSWLWIIQKSPAA
jgi:hypothetical protein